MPTPRYFVLTALRREARAIARAFGARTPRGNTPVELPGCRVRTELYVVGMGAIRIPDLSGQAVAGIIMAGLAGALDPSLKVGDVLMDQSSTWRASRLNYKRVWFHGADHIVRTAEEKSQLFGQTGSALVEMENAAVKRAAKSFNLPFLGLRAISDTAAESLNPAALELIDPYGSLRVGSLIKATLRSPKLVQELRRLARSSAVALDALATTVREVLAPAD
ncbi:MAG TPA: hypothetical protein VH475_26470 [Tepidisphaeraceae bacterium]